MDKTNNLNWKKYEVVTRYIYETLGKEFGIKIEGYGHNFKVKGKSGVDHQIDVLTLQSYGIYECRTAIECKYLRKKINKDTVMKLSSIINDAGIDKGIIVSKSGFTKDASEFAKHCNIELVQLREIEETDKDVKLRQLEIGSIEISTNYSITRPEILSIQADAKETQLEIDVAQIYRYIIKEFDGDKIPLKDYVKLFQNELHRQGKLFQIITKGYTIIDGILINKQTGIAVEIKEVMFTGMLKKMDGNSDRKFSLVDQVWLIMKSIFEERTLTISENGIITEEEKC
jgi:hypothetical protein